MKTNTCWCLAVAVFAGCSSNRDTIGVAGTTAPGPAVDTGDRDSVNVSDSARDASIGESRDASRNAMPSPQPDAGSSNSTSRATSAPDASTSVPPGGASEGGGASVVTDAGTTPAVGRDAAASVRDGAAAGPKRVFILRATTTGAFGGVAGGDRRCQIGADAAGLGGRWRAYLSDSTHEAPDRIHGDGPWVARAPSSVVFPTHASLRGYPHMTVSYDEYGGVVSQPEYWTGTEVQGAIGETCLDWTATSTGTTGTSGSDSETARWTDNGATACSSALHLLCFEE